MIMLQHLTDGYLKPMNRAFQLMASLEGTNLTGHHSILILRCSCPASEGRLRVSIESYIPSPLPINPEALQHQGGRSVVALIRLPYHQVHHKPPRLVSHGTLSLGDALFRGSESLYEVIMVVQERQKHRPEHHRSGEDQRRDGNIRSRHHSTQ
jgi:hypothetical protein